MSYFGFILLLKGTGHFTVEGTILFHYYKVPDKQNWITVLSEGQKEVGGEQGLQLNADLKIKISPTTKKTLPFPFS